MTNLLQETIETLKKHGKTPSDVRWVGDKNGWSTWNNFADIADIEYDNGFGGNEVASSLVIVGDEWWLERHEYDGSEWWEFKTLPVKPDSLRKIKSVLNIDYDNKITYD